ncbi:MAG: methyltransferase [Gammaproteobacteria bacterium]|nr:MAG: methyltransferase [Gammaproteobacteria bacterium]
MRAQGGSERAAGNTGRERLRRGPWLAALLLAAVGSAGAGGAERPAAPGFSLAELAVGAHRDPGNAERNRYRHPVETLEFFGLRPDSHVVEIWPAGGWYTEIIAPYVNERGQYYAAHWDPESDSEFVRRAVERFRAKLAAHPELYGNAKMTVLMPPDKWEMAPEGSADLVLTFRNIHNWMPRGYAAEMFAAAYRALKPGGVLGVVEHRGDPDVPQDPKAASGYVNEDYAIQLAEAAGFVLEARSEINANPADTKDYEGGVWTLPPTLRKKDEDRAKYLAIGESDRFTLRFRKPADGVR